MYDFFSIIISTLKNCFRKSEDSIYTLTIPVYIFYRTQLICKYITHDKGYLFEIENFLMLIYEDFISNCIKKFSSIEIIKNISKYDNDSIIISNGTFKESILRGHKTCCIQISIEDSLTETGKIICAELYESNGFKIDFQTLFERIWINYISDYLNGDNEKAYTNILKMLK